MKTKRQRHYTRMRAKARRIFVGGLSSPFSECGYCRRKIVWREKLDSGSISKIEPETIAFFDESGAMVVLPFGRVVHIVPLAERGTNQLTNLIGCCQQCNFDKDRFLNANCPKCKVRLKASDPEKYCRRCHKQNTSKLRRIKFKRK